MTPGSPLEEAAALWIAGLSRRGITAAVTSSLANGLRAEVTRGAAKCRVNLFFSRTRGFSVIYAGGDRQLAIEAAQARAAEPQARTGRHVGMDEAGKGDYFGPLVASAVCLDPGQAAILRASGVADSKTLTDARIAELARAVREGSTAFSTVALDPPEYNAWFEREKAGGRNSLDMLAALHGMALSRLISTCPHPDSVLLDKFCSPARLALHIPAELRVEMRTGAESDTAVAAASILARDEYVRHLEDLRKAFGVPFPAGSSGAADEAGRVQVLKHGRGSLHMVAKVHFRNTLRIV